MRKWGLTPFLHFLCSGRSRDGSRSERRVAGGLAVYLELPPVSLVGFQRQSHEAEDHGEIHLRPRRYARWPADLEFPFLFDLAWRVPELDRIPTSVSYTHLTLPTLY